MYLRLMGIAGYSTPKSFDAFDDKSITSRFQPAKRFILRTMEATKR